MDLSKLFDASNIEITEDVSKMEEVLEYEEILLSISKIIIQYRKENNLTQEQLAKKLGIKQSMVVKLERGNNNPTIKSLYKISSKLVHSSELFTEMLRDMIKTLYKNNDLNYNIHYRVFETFQHDNENITYLNNYAEDGGTFYGRINTTNSKISVVR